MFISFLLCVYSFSVNLLLDPCFTLLPVSLSLFFHLLDPYLLCYWFDFFLNNLLKFRISLSRFFVFRVST